MTITSAWVCGDCNLAEDGVRKVRKVCHHCGKLLCQDCVRAFDDGAFAGRPLAHNRRAAHCRECRDSYHIRLPSR
jgi:hypothetical protein